MENVIHHKMQCDLYGYPLKTRKTSKKQTESIALDGNL